MFYFRQKDKTLQFTEVDTDYCVIWCERMGTSFELPLFSGNMKRCCSGNIAKVNSESAYDITSMLLDSGRSTKRIRRKPPVGGINRGGMSLYAWWHHKVKK